MNNPYRVQIHWVQPYQQDKEEQVMIKKLKHDYKVLVNARESKEIQELVFKNGGSWNGGDIDVDFTNQKCLYISKKLVLSYTTERDTFFDNHPNTLTTPNEIIKELKEMLEDCSTGGNAIKIGNK